MGANTYAPGQDWKTETRLSPSHLKYTMDKMSEMMVFKTLDMIPKTTSISLVTALGSCFMTLSRSYGKEEQHRQSPGNSELSEVRWKWESSETKKARIQVQNKWGRKELYIERTLQMYGQPSLSIQINLDDHLCMRKWPKAGERKPLMKVNGAWHSHNIENSACLYQFGWKTSTFIRYWVACMHAWIHSFISILPSFSL